MIHTGFIIGLHNFIERKEWESMKKNIGKCLTALIVATLFSILFAATVMAANVTVVYVTPDRIVTKVAPQGTDMTYQGPRDINISGYAFCGWSVPLANVQQDTIAYAIFLPIGNESQSVVASYAYHHLPTGVLSFSTAHADTIPEPTRNLKNPITIMEKPTTLTAQQTIDLNPVGDPGKTCVVKWYNGSTGELWKSDVVPYGTTMPDPDTPCYDDLDFVGWDGSWSNITSDRSITACYYKKFHITYKCGVCDKVFKETYSSSSSIDEDVSRHGHDGYEFDEWSTSVHEKEVVATARYDKK